MGQRSREAACRRKTACEAADRLRPDRGVPEEEAEGGEVSKYVGSCSAVAERFSIWKCSRRRGVGQYIVLPRAVVHLGPRWRSEDRGRVCIRGGGANGRSPLKILSSPSSSCLLVILVLVVSSSSITPPLLSLFSSSSSCLFRSAFPVPCPPPSPLLLPGALLPLRCPPSAAAPTSSPCAPTSW